MTAHRPTTYNGMVVTDHWDDDELELPPGRWVGGLIKRFEPLFDVPLSTDRQREPVETRSLMSESLETIEPTHQKGQPWLTSK